VELLIWLAVVALPFIVVIGVIVGLVWWLTRRRNK
jgi:hypothetical protein